MDVKNGRKIGFPTINVDAAIDYVLPKNGVYGAKVLSLMVKNI